MVKKRKTYLVNLGPETLDLSVLLKALHAIHVLLLLFGLLQAGYDLHLVLDLSLGIPDLLVLGAQNSLELFFILSDGLDLPRQLSRVLGSFGLQVFELFLQVLDSGLRFLL